MECCNVGELLSDDQCHKLSYVNKTGLKKIDELPQTSKDLLRLRKLISPENHRAESICYHHETIYCTSKFEIFHHSCCDPFKRHKKKITNLRVVTLDLATKQRSVKPGEKICRNCQHKLQTTDVVDLESPLNDEQYQVDLTQSTEIVNESLTSFGCSPINLKSVSTGQRKSLGKRKCVQLKSALKSNMSKVINIDPSTLSSSSGAECSQMESQDMSQLIYELKLKYATSSKKQKIQILTLVPSSWTISKTVRESKTSKYMVQKARKVKRASGILAEPTAKRGNLITDDVKALVFDFYHDDAVSRQMPGKKDFVSVIMDGERVHKQKRLLLANLSEIYSEFKKKFTVKLRFSTFARLRPKWCIIVGSAGAHSVCVCLYHQNVKLMIASLPVKIDYKDLLNKIVCDIFSRTCMLHRCDSCPGKDNVEGFIEKLSEDAGIDADDFIEFSQWQTTDRSTIINRQEARDVFCSVLVDQLDDLCSHHFISKSQAKYLRESKENLRFDTVIVLLDFSENYSFVIQDAAQSFYWDNSQATLHPVAVYTKNDAHLVEHSYCIMSDLLKHDVYAVQAVITEIIKEIKDKHPNIKNVKYFSDGAASQYKNCKTFTNLCFHEQYFDISAQWHFFATSHGKGPCDGIGGTIKRLVTRASLQAISSGHILTPIQLFAFANENITGINSIFISSADITAIETESKARLMDSKTISGTRSHHCFLPISSNKLKIYRISDDLVKDNYSSISYISTGKSYPSINRKDENIPGKYVAAMYDDLWYAGMIQKCCDDSSDVQINFMSKNGNKLSWPERADICWIPSDNIMLTKSSSMQR